MLSLQQGPLKTRRQWEWDT